MASKFWTKPGSSSIIVSDASYSKIIFSPKCPCNTKWTLWVVTCNASANTEATACAWSDPFVGSTICGTLQDLQQNQDYPVPTTIQLLQDNWVTFRDTDNDALTGYWATKGDKCCMDTTIPVPLPDTAGLPDVDCCKHCSSVYKSICSSGTWSTPQLQGATDCAYWDDLVSSLPAAYAAIDPNTWLDVDGTAYYIQRDDFCLQGTQCTSTPPAKPQLPCSGTSYGCYIAWVLRCTTNQDTQLPEWSWPTGQPDFIAQCDDNNTSSAQWPVDEWVYDPDGSGPRAIYYHKVNCQGCCTSTTTVSTTCIDAAVAYAGVAANRPTTLPEFDCQGGEPCYWWQLYSQSVGKITDGVFPAWSQPGYKANTINSALYIKGTASQTGFNAAKASFSSDPSSLGVDFTSYAYTDVNTDWLQVVKKPCTMLATMYMRRAGAIAFITSSTWDNTPTAPAAPANVSCAAAGQTRRQAMVFPASATPVVASFAPTTIYGTDLPNQLV